MDEIEQNQNQNQKVTMVHRLLMPTALGFVLLFAVAGIYLFAAKKLINFPFGGAKHEQQQKDSGFPGYPEASEGAKAQVRTYFKQVAPAEFKEEFLTNVTDQSAGAFVKFRDDKDVDASRNFYIMLNAPSVNQKDPTFSKMILKVRADIDKKLGKSLF